MNQHEPHCMSNQAWDIPNSCTCYRNYTLTMADDITTPSYRAHLPNLVKAIQTWQKETFPQATERSVLAHLKSELKELYDCPTDKEEMADVFLLLVGLAGDKDLIQLFDTEIIGEMLDGVEYAQEVGASVWMRGTVLSLLLLLASKHNVDLYEAAWNKLEKNKKRKWGKPNAEGYVEHVEEGE